MELDAGSFNVRMRQFRRTPAGHSVAAGCIPPLEGHLTDKLTAATIVLKLVLEGAQKKMTAARKSWASCESTIPTCLVRRCSERQDSEAWIRGAALDVSVGTLKQSEYASRFATGLLYLSVWITCTLRVEPLLDRLCRVQPLHLLPTRQRRSDVDMS